MGADLYRVGDQAQEWLFIDAPLRGRMVRPADDA